MFSDRKSGKTAQREVPKESETALIGKKIGEVIDGSIVGLSGLKLKITGLSDNSGFPSIPGIEGGRKVKVLLRKKKGLRKRSIVRGNTITNTTSQINTTIESSEIADLESLFKKKDENEKPK
ncbi:MAG: S6e family ribosomal protein [Candidatus Micrarchaeaceae archaeon]